MFFHVLLDQLGPVRSSVDSLGADEDAVIIG
jgi:hypothetical protein